MRGKVVIHRALGFCYNIQITILTFHLSYLATKLSHFSITRVILRLWQRCCSCFLSSPALVTLFTFFLLKWCSVDRWALPFILEIWTGNNIDSRQDIFCCTDLDFSKQTHLIFTNGPHWILNDIDVTSNNSLSFKFCFCFDSFARVTKGQSDKDIIFDINSRMS